MQYYGELSKPKQHELWRRCISWIHYIKDIDAIEEGLRLFNLAKQSGFEEKGNLTKASHFWMEAVKMGHPSGYSYIGYLMLILSNPNKAFEYFEAALSLYPRDPDARRFIEHLQQQAKALETYKANHTRPFPEEFVNTFKDQDPKPEILPFKFDDGTIFTAADVPEPLQKPSFDDGLESFWSPLPRDVVNEIFAWYMAPPQLCQLRLVSKQFRDWADQPVIWILKLLARFHNSAGGYSDSIWFEEKIAKKMYIANHAEYIARRNCAYQPWEKVTWPFIATEGFLTSSGSGLVADPNGAIHGWGRIQDGDKPFTPLGKPYSASPYSGPISSLDATTNGFIASYKSQHHGLEYLRCNIDDPNISATNFYLKERWHREVEENISLLHIHKKAEHLIAATDKGFLKLYDTNDGTELWSIPSPVFEDGNTGFVTQILTKNTLGSDAFVVYRAQAGEPCYYLAHLDTAAGKIVTHMCVEPGVEVNQVEWNVDTKLLTGATNMGVLVWSATTPPKREGFVCRSAFSNMASTAWQILGLNDCTVNILELRMGLLHPSPFVVDIPLQALGIPSGIMAESADAFSVCRGNVFRNYELKKPDYYNGIFDPVPADSGGSLVS